MKKVYLIHGWNGFPNNHWFPWLKKELEKLNFKVESLEMPNSKHPKLKEWLNHLNKSIEPNKDTYLVGHSLGCITIVRYLESLPENVKIKGCIFVAGFSFLNYKEIKEFYEKNPDINIIKAKKVLEKEKGHFCLNDSVDKLPSVLNTIKVMSR